MVGRESNIKKQDNIFLLSTKHALIWREQTLNVWAQSFLKKHLDCFALLKWHYMELCKKLYDFSEG